MPAGPAERRPAIILAAPSGAHLVLRNADGYRLSGKIAVAVRIGPGTGAEWIEALDGCGRWLAVGEVGGNGNVWRIESGEDAADSGAWT